MKITYKLLAAVLISVFVFALGINFLQIMSDPEYVEDLSYTDYSKGIGNSISSKEPVFNLPKSNNSSVGVENINESMMAPTTSNSFYSYSGSMKSINNNVGSSDMYSYRSASGAGSNGGNQSVSQQGGAGTSSTFGISASRKMNQSNSVQQFNTQTSSYGSSSGNNSIIANNSLQNENSLFANKELTGGIELLSGPPAETGGDDEDDFGDGPIGDGLGLLLLFTFLYVIKRIK